MLPPETLDQIEHRRLERLRRAQETPQRGARALTHVEMQIAVAQVAVAHDLALGDQPRAPAPSPPSMSLGMHDTGTEMSCLRLAPWWRCASGTDSRSFHIACALREGRRDRGVLDDAARHALAAIRRPAAPRDSASGWAR